MSARESKPNLSHSQVSDILSRLYRLTVSIIRPLPSYDDQNFYVAPTEGGEYVLKVMNSADSQNIDLIELQTLSMNFLHGRGLPAQTAVPNWTGALISLEEFDCGFGVKKYLVRLLTYLPGLVIAKISCSPQILYDVGKMAATLDTVLLQFKHPNLRVLHRENFIWSLSSIPLLSQYIHVMDGDPIQDVVKGIIEQYQSQVIPKVSLFRKCIVHGDFNDHNLLVKPDGSSGYFISGILDFGDMSWGCFIFELAITIMYMMIESPSPLTVAGPLLDGWESVFPLNDAERESLYWLVLSRFCQSLVLGRFAVTQQPENEQYLMITTRKGLKILHQLWELGKVKVERMWFQGSKKIN
ncbi:hypothetical protein DNTS_022347 [Danionella cerebrum]|uniref:Hydroxylysine kinase n=1 Tax=Danionella cerebrum TaxID=2873325 RepID=A0A553RCV8_9TELE|nr:hypothetical protein DNTS_022347 [Danionella translucida]TRZ00005.1 hypothetical protein DNTS_022347 [Danionella translucida]